ncbi:DUF3343 domain-containing protein [Paenibacillus xerothermodurans]|uniref:DUF3343 domain-containing protein n=1 Tax=Paenibacillus xerothermodurans TaxID=1977292 RepID=A0A2W1N3Z4_PAEXE|nr:DUF3343 domain-containing protein [Paenibacillus xerothermodurans]PZE19077.1 DUF3343 domain-containing protein [Paenibacillus xerothermodurans]
MLLMAFDSTQQAIRAEMLLDYAEIENDICPTPKEVTAGCALSLQFPREDYERVKEIVAEEKIEIRGIYFKKDNEYVTMEA